MSRKRVFTAGADDFPGLREFLAEKLKISRRAAKELLDKRLVFVNSKRVWMAKTELRAGDQVEVLIDPQEERQAPPGVAVLYSDQQLLIVNKRSGMLTQGSASVEEQLRRDEQTRGVLAVHRLDQDTSGCLIFARSAQIKEKMVELFRRKEIFKQYRAIVCGKLNGAGVIDTAIEGKPALTRYRVTESSAVASLAEVQIETGRMHQIRKHMAEIGHPLAGDKEYLRGRVGNALLRAVPRQMLHAERLEFPHPETGMTIAVAAPFPEDFLSTAAELELKLNN